MIAAEIQHKIDSNSAQIKSIAHRIHALEEEHLAEPSNSDYIELLTQHKKLVDENRRLMDELANK
ncbi:hypothetical protein KDN34_13350 [Shewanella yunxiaonensis]|uniref:Uncharacterized protein n=1 Tax=Shewanella yunxiaonensis TaxID=2829809 RepID=A0ABX7YS65_9GAMM|nr:MULTISPECIES: hypothetical protein [Shewanella]MDF0534030.1 hypothetical protein [Shewanella sp. A32]QUN05179.1 hypothetical protein KDN34_13350 [Shewanella yunxiaonensis]